MIQETESWIYLFVVITMMYAAGICFVYSPSVATRVGGVLISCASMMVGYRLVGWLSGWIVCSLAILICYPPPWARRQSDTAPRTKNHESDVAT
jgi:hypothetical protein